MQFRDFKRKLRNLRLRILRYLVQKPRILKHQWLSTCNRIHGKPVCYQPAQLDGSGQIYFGNRVSLGCYPSPHYFSGYVHIEARGKNTTVKIGDGTWVNNNFSLICEHTSISIGKKVLIGTNVEIYDSDFHGIDPELRNISDPQNARPVVIADNVFIGSNVKITKGVKIGTNSVIANGSVVVNDIPDNVVAGGVPAKVIRVLNAAPHV